jgi:hypothetical protein
MIAASNTIKINFDAVVDISDCSTFQVAYVDPDGVSGTWDGVLTNTHTIQIIFLYGVLKAGKYKVKIKAYTGTTLYFTSPNWCILEIGT